MKFETQSGGKLLSISLCDETEYLGLSLSATPIMQCCSALKNHLLCSIFAWHMKHTIFILTFILECINESTNNLYHTMTVLLEYIDHSLEFSINA